jgi:hypothetical protein
MGTDTDRYTTHTLTVKAHLFTCVKALLSTSALLKAHLFTCVKALLFTSTLTQ